MAARMVTCGCNKHPSNPNGVCGQSYVYFGHEGWGEPYGRGSRCPSCDTCFSRGHRGLNLLARNKQKIGDWLNSSNPDVLLGQTSFNRNKSSYAISNRLYPSFSMAVAKKNRMIREPPICRSRFLFETEVSGVWQLNQNSGRYELKPDYNHNPLEQGWTIDFNDLDRDIREQEPECPICKSELRLMMHEGWTQHPEIGYGNERRPIRIYYLSCEHDWQRYSPNNPIKSNEYAPPFNPHPKLNIETCSFWHTDFRYLKI